MLIKICLKRWQPGESSSSRELRRRAVHSGPEWPKTAVFKFENIKKVPKAKKIVKMEILNFLGVFLSKIFPI